jgi:hypothetical protein
MPVRAQLLLASCPSSTTTILDGLRGHGGCSRREGGLELDPQARGEDVPGAADEHGHLVGDHASETATGSPSADTTIA